MNFINISSFRKAQIILRINAFLLFLFIIATPYLIKSGSFGLSEPTVEGFFLAIEIGVLVRLFKNYDFHSNKNDRRANKLSGELKEQKELSVDTLKYLGKINVQLSIIKQLVKKFKAPAQKKRLEHSINEMLSVISGLINNEMISLRIVDLSSGKTIVETSLSDDGFAKCISNKKIYKINNNIIDNKIHIIPSAHDNFSLKTFVLVKQSGDIKSEQLELVKDIVNQCEIMYLLFQSKYHKQ
jgi:hypothetical protein